MYKIYKRTALLLSVMLRVVGSGVFVYRPDPVLPHFTEIGSTSHVFVWEMQDIVAKFSHSIRPIGLLLWEGL